MDTRFRSVESQRTPGCISWDCRGCTAEGPEFCSALETMLLISHLTLPHVTRSLPWPVRHCETPLVRSREAVAEAICVSWPHNLPYAAADLGRNSWNNNFKRGLNCSSSLCSSRHRRGSLAVFSWYRRYDSRISHTACLRSASPRT